MTDQPGPLERVRALAQSLDCITEEDFQLLANITEGTAEAWRKRGRGPAYVLIGKRVLYPRAAVAALLQTLVRERVPVSGRSML